MQLVRPFWVGSAVAGQARAALLGVTVLLLVNTGGSVLWSFLARDLFDALTAGDQAAFRSGLLWLTASLLVGVPMSVLHSHFMVRCCTSATRL